MIDRFVVMVSHYVQLGKPSSSWKIGWVGLQVATQYIFSDDTVNRTDNRRSKNSPHLSHKLILLVGFAHFPSIDA